MAFSQKIIIRPMSEELYKNLSTAQSRHSTAAGGATARLGPLLALIANECCLIGLFNRLTNFELKLVNRKNQFDDELDTKVASQYIYLSI